MNHIAKPGLVPIEDAMQRLLGSTQPTSQIQTVPLQQALGKVLAQNIDSQIDVPPADNSAMDGYCLRLADYAEGKALPVSQRIPAGAVPQPLQPGTAARIFTGAEMPEHADCVVMQEDCTESDTGLMIHEAPVPGQHIRPRGQDIHKGQAVLEQGQRLRAQELGLLASIGIECVQVYQPLKVAILSTGDELVEPGQPLQKGQIYNSNRYTLIGLLQGLGMDILDLGAVADDCDATEAVLRRAAAEADVIISSGGVSVGEEDHIKTVLSALGDIQLWKLAIKPGKPFTYGHVLGTPFLGLPGNPAAVFVTFTLLCRPWLLKTQGATAYMPRSQQVMAGFDWKLAGKRQEYLRVRLELRGDKTMAVPHPNQSSGVLSSASWSDGFVVVPVGTTIAVGDSVRYLPFENLLY